MTGKTKRAQYTLEFKLEAVRLVKAGCAMRRSHRCAQLMAMTGKPAVCLSEPYEPTLIRSVTSLAMTVWSAPNTPAGITNFPP